MSVQELQISIKDLIESIHDEQFLNAIYSILNNQVQKDWWETISAPEREAIEEGLAQLDRGEKIPHEQVVQRLRETYL